MFGRGNETLKYTEKQLDLPKKVPKLTQESQSEHLYGSHDRHERGRSGAQK
jgi:hypothetical protein